MTSPDRGPGRRRFAGRRDRIRARAGSGSGTGFGSGSGFGSALGSGAGPADPVELDAAVGRWPFAPPQESDRPPAWAAGSPPWARSLSPAGRPVRWGPPRAVTLWVPVILSFLVQVVPAVVAFGRGGRTGMGLLVIVLALVGPAALVFARRFPGPVVAITAAAACVDLLFTPGSGAPYLALAFAIVSAMVRSARNWAIGSVAVGWLVALVGAILLGIDWHPFRIIATSLGILVVILVGEGIRTRSHRVAQFQAAARRRREEAAQAERERIARELHDVLAHSLSQINVQAGMGLHLIQAHPEKAEEALANIKATSKTALDEVRGVLGFLRSEGSSPGSPALDDAPTLFDYSAILGEAGYAGDAPGAAGAGAAAAASSAAAPLAPQADLSRLPALVSSVSTSNLHVELENRLAAPPPPGIQLALFRITQESLTNVTRHAGASEARVVLEEQGDDYVLRVSDNGLSHRAGSGRSSGGRGLLGMKERAELLGGRLEAGPLSTGGFAVVATVPRVARRSRP